MQNLNKLIFRKPQIHTAERVVWQDGFYYKIGHFPGYKHTIIDNLSTEQIEALLDSLNFDDLLSKHRKKNILNIEGENLKNWLNNYQDNILPNLENGVGDKRLVLSPKEKEYLRVKAKLYREIVEYQESQKIAQRYITFHQSNIPNSQGKSNS